MNRAKAWLLYRRTEASASSEDECDDCEGIADRTPCRSSRLPLTSRRWATREGRRSLTRILRLVTVDRRAALTIAGALAGICCVAGPLTLRRQRSPRRDLRRSGEGPRTAAHRRGVGWRPHRGWVFVPPSA